MAREGIGRQHPTLVPAWIVRPVPGGVERGPCSASSPPLGKPLAPVARHPRPPWPRSWPPPPSATATGSQRILADCRVWSTASLRPATTPSARVPRSPVLPPVSGGRPDGEDRHRADADQGVRRSQATGARPGQPAGGAPGYPPCTRPRSPVRSASRPPQRRSTKMRLRPPTRFPDHLRHQRSQGPPRHRLALLIGAPPPARSSASPPCTPPVAAVGGWQVAKAWKTWGQPGPSTPPASSRAPSPWPRRSASGWSAGVPGGHPPPCCRGSPPTVPAATTSGRSASPCRAASSSAWPRRRRRSPSASTSVGSISAHRVRLRLRMGDFINKPARAAASRPSRRHGPASCSRSPWRSVHLPPFEGAGRPVRGRPAVLCPLGRTAGSAILPAPTPAPPRCAASVSRSSSLGPAGRSGQPVPVLRAVGLAAHRGPGRTQWSSHPGRSATTGFETLPPEMLSGGSTCSPGIPRGSACSLLQLRARRRTYTPS